MSSYGNNQNTFAAPNAYGGYATGPSSSSNVELAGRGTRFLAILVDGIIIAPISFVLGFGLGMGLAVVMGPDFVQSIGGNIVLQLVGWVLGVATYLLLNGYFLVSSGQTIGKKLLKIRVVRDGDTEVPDLTTTYFKRIFITQALSLIPILGGLYALVDALMIFSADQKCLHDQIAGTRVIKC
jgi:uncharacterized RDD family membrane protein YckC